MLRICQEKLIMLRICQENSLKLIMKCPLKSSFDRIDQFNKHLSFIPIVYKFRKTKS